MTSCWACYRNRFSTPLLQSFNQHNTFFVSKITDVQNIYLTFSNENHNTLINFMYPHGIGVIRHQLNFRLVYIISNIPVHTVWTTFHPLNGKILKWKWWWLIDRSALFNDARANKIRCQHQDTEFWK